MKNNNIPQGYKGSPLGIIPMEWEVKRLKEIAKITSGATPLRANNLFFEGGNIPWVKTTDLNNSMLSETEECVTEKAINETSLKILPKDTVLVAMYGGFNQIGRTGMLLMDAVINQALSALLCDAKKATPEYVLFWLNAKVGLWKNFAASSRKDPNITSKDVSDFPILTPPLPEQNRIAEVLSYWDAVIEKQSALVDALKRRKRALMQQLLTGKKRLGNFNDPWESVRLGEIGTTYNGLVGKTKQDFDCGDDYYIPYVNIFNNTKVDITKLGKVSIGNEKQNRAKYGDVFFTVSSETPNEVGMSAVLLESFENLYLNSFCFGYRLNNFSILQPEFAAYYLRSQNFRKKMAILAQGSTRFNLSKLEVLNIKISLPSLAEQTAIAEVLTASDKEIELATKKLETLRMQKRGLMQVLLSGKKRLKI